MTDPSTFVVRAAQLLTMPEECDELAHYDPARIEDRDRNITGLIEDGCVFVKKGTVEFVGAWSERPEAAKKSKLPLMSTKVAMPRPQ